MTTLYDKLSVIPLNPEWNKRTCDYWYLVRQSYSAHTAFHKRESLLMWLANLNLTIDQTLLAPHKQGGEWDGAYPTWLPVIGSYRKQAHMSYDAFYNLENVIIETKALSNGDYTMARITADSDGLRTIHTLNPNCKFRPVYDHRSTQLEIG